MFRILKKIIKGFFITLILLIACLIAIPLFFKDKIKAEVLEKIDNNINADVYFTDFSFSSFKNFPRFTITFHNACIVGLNEFKDDTLISAKEISASFDIHKLIKGSDFEINGIDLEEPVIYARVLPNGKANYTIAKAAPVKDTVKTASNFKLDIDKWSINNGKIIYNNQAQNTYIEVGGLYHSGSGDFKQEISDLDIVTKVTDLTLVYNGITYFDKKLFAADLLMEMNFKEKKFIFKDHTFQLGNFKFGFNGYFKLLESGYETDLAFIVKETDFKNLLSLLPGIYQKDMEGIKTKGEFSCTGFMKGVYDAGANKVPAFHLDLKVNNAMFKYAHLPKAIEKINFHLIADNPDGNAEHSTYDLKTFHFEMDKDPVHGRIFIKGQTNLHINADIKLSADLAELEKFYPINGLILKGLLKTEIKIDGKYNASLKLFPKVDAFITLEKGYLKSNQAPLDMDSIHINAELLNTNGKYEDTRISLNNMTFLLDDEPFTMKGTISDLNNFDYDLTIDGLVDLGKLTQLYPVKNTSISGSLNFDITTDGNLAEIEAKKFDLLKTSGTLEAKNISYKTTDVAFPVHIDDALFTFTPDKIILNLFKAEFGKSNVSLSGHLFNYIPYLLRHDAPIKGDLVMNCDTIDMNEWFPASVADNNTAVKADSTAPSANATEIPVIPKNIDFTIDSDIKLFKFGKIHISKLDGEVKIKNGILTLNETGFNTMNAPFVVSGDYDPTNISHPVFDLNIEVDKLDINTAYQMFVDDKNPAPAQGNFSTRYSLKGELSPDFSPIYSTLIGKGQITIDKVSVKGMKLFNHIKTVSKKEEFNNPELEDIIIDTEIKNGKLLLYPFSFKVSKFITEVEGEQAFENDKINYLIKLSVPPFKKIKIPVSIIGTSEKPVIKLGKGFDDTDFEKL